MSVLALAAAVGCSAVGFSGPPPASYAVDPMWPQPLPAGWILGSVTGVAVDGRDHVWVVHRGAASLNARTEMGLATDPKTAETCCEPAPPVLDFDAAGLLVGRWGGPGAGYDWPRSPGGMAVDADGNVWIAAAGAPAPAAGRGGRGGGARGAGRGGAGAGRGGETPSPPPPPEDAHVLKFSRDGKFLMQIGRAGDLGTAESRAALNKPANVDVDPSANELYVADTGSNRVVVFDAATGAYKRHWGGHGEPFRAVTCAAVSADGMVYVCDRAANRIQVFRTDGTFVKEARMAPETAGSGAVWDIGFTRDRGQTQLIVADGQNQKVWLLNRDTLQVTGSVGAGGRWPGHFFGVTAVAVDAAGNLYTGETLEGKRVQKFVAGQ
jgi:DNA-binding beta-propeller fold protein YncE